MDMNDKCTVVFVRNGQQEYSQMFRVWSLKILYLNDGNKQVTIQSSFKDYIFYWLQHCAAMFYKCVCVCVLSISSTSRPCVLAEILIKMLLVKIILICWLILPNKYMMQSFRVRQIIGFISEGNPNYSRTLDPLCPHSNQRNCGESLQLQHLEGRGQRIKI